MRLVVCRRHLLVVLEEEGEAFLVGLQGLLRAEGTVDCAIEDAVGLEWAWCHRERIVYVGEADARLFLACLQDALAGRDDGGALLVGDLGQRQGVPDDLVREVEIRL